MIDYTDNNTLFVGDLALFATKESLRESFSPYGEILDVFLKLGNDKRTMLGYGFIRFATREQAETAMNEMNGVMHHGRPLRIGWANAGLSKAKNKSEIPRTAQVLTSFVAKNADAIVTEEILTSLFSQYGRVVDATIKKTMIDRETKYQTGYGFVHYPADDEGIAAALRVIELMSDNIIDNVAYDCHISETFRRLLHHKGISVEGIDEGGSSKPRASAKRTPTSVAHVNSNSRSNPDTPIGNNRTLEPVPVSHQPMHVHPQNVPHPSQPMHPTVSSLTPLSISRTGSGVLAQSTYGSPPVQYTDIPPVSIDQRQHYHPSGIFNHPAMTPYYNSNGSCEPYPSQGGYHVQQPYQQHIQYPPQPVYQWVYNGQQPSHSQHEFSPVDDMPATRHAYRQHHPRSGRSPHNRNSRPTLPSPSGPSTNTTNSSTGTSPGLEGSNHSSGKLP